MIQLVKRLLAILARRRRRLARVVSPGCGVPAPKRTRWPDDDIEPPSAGAWREASRRRRHG